MQRIELIIIGAGPTGLNIGIEAKKAGLNYLIIEKGSLVNSIFHFPANMTFFSTSKNLEIADIPFISHADKPTRKEALEYYRRLAESYALNIHYYEVVYNCQNEKDGFIITTSSSEYQAKFVVVATGFYDIPRWLNVPGENLPKVKHYYDEAHPYVGQKVLIVGAANSACDVALETWQKGAQVTMAVRASELYDKVKYWILPNIKNRIAEGSIKAYFSTTVQEILPKKVVLQSPEGIVTIENDFVLAMTGYKPNYDLLVRLGVPIDDNLHQTPSYNLDNFETTTPNLFVGGVLNAGLATSKLFIENTRHHGKKIITSILGKMNA